MTRNDFTVSDWEISHTYSSYLVFDEIDLEKMALCLVMNDLAELVIQSNEIFYWKFNGELQVAKLILEFHDRNAGVCRLEQLVGSTLDMTESIKFCFNEVCNLIFSDQKLFNTADVKNNIRVYFHKFLAKYSYGEFLILPYFKIFEDGVVLLKYRFGSDQYDIKIHDFIENFVNIGINTLLDIKVSPTVSKLSSIAYNCSIKKNIFSRFQSLKDAKVHIQEVNKRTESYKYDDEILELVELARNSNKENFSSLTLTYLNIINFIYMYPKVEWKFVLFGLDKKINKSTFWLGRPYIYLIDFKEKQNLSSENNQKFYKEFIGITQRAYNPYANISDLPKDLRLFEDSSDFILASGYLCAFASILNKEEIQYSIYNKEVISEYLEYGYIIHRALYAKTHDSSNLSETFLLRADVNNLDQFYEISYSGEVRILLEHGWKEFGLSNIKKQIDEAIKIDQDHKNYKYQIFNNNFNRVLTILFGFLAIPTIAKEIVVPFWKHSEIMYPKNESSVLFISLVISFLAITSVLYLANFFLKTKK